MAALALADVLPDFGTLRPAPPVGPAAPKGGTELRETAAPAPATMEETPEELLAKEIAKAEAALAERLGREHKEQLAAEREKHAAEMERVMHLLGEEAGTAIAARFAEMQANIATAISAHAARILGTTLTEDLKKRAADELARIICRAIDDAEAVRVRVRGSALLFEPLRAKLGERAGQVDFTEAPGFDLTAEIEESVFETRLGDWSETLAEVLS